MGGGGGGEGEGREEGLLTKRKKKKKREKKKKKRRRRSKGRVNEICGEIIGLAGILSDPPGAAGLASCQPFLPTQACDV